MESEVPTPRFTVGREIATFLVSCGLLRKVWAECLTSASNAESFTVNEYEDVAYVTFPSFQRIEDFIANGGEGNRQTDNNVFSGCFKGNDGTPALIHPGALTLFRSVMENTDFKEKIDQLKINTDSKQRKVKPVVFVGHSLGGAVATLATLWVLEKRLRARLSPFCITFGCPLVGDVNLVQAIGRENWASSFCHVVSKNDIVPRMLLAPFESTAGPLNALLPYWRSEISNAMNDQLDSSVQNAYRTLLQSVSKSGSSPYKPFGTYMFCSSLGATCITNSQIVLEMLRLTMQSRETPPDCLLEHVRYGSLLENVLQNHIREARKVNYESESSYEMGISLQLEAIEVGVDQNDDARTALEREGEIEHKLNTKVAGLATELSKKQSMMAELEWYKEDCEQDGDIGYYDTFRNEGDTEYNASVKIGYYYIFKKKGNIGSHDTSKEKEDKGKKAIRADQNRIRLGIFWDDIIEMWESNELPSDFQSQNKWINAGNTYRRLVEPLDIAYYYRTNPDGNYISDGRPNRYKVLEKWMEEKEKTRSSRGPGPRTKQASLPEDSCFWARVEEALKDLKNLKQGQQQSRQNLQEFEEYVERMIRSKSGSSDISLWATSYMIWDKQWKKYKSNRTSDGLIRVILQFLFCCRKAAT